MEVLCILCMIICLVGTTASLIKLSLDESTEDQLISIGMILLNGIGVYIWYHLLLKFITP